MKLDKLGIKWKIFFFLLGFTGILLVILWFVQTVYLESFYKDIKESDIENAMSNVEQVIEDDEFDSAVETIGINYDLNILVTDMYGSILYSYEQDTDSIIHRLPSSELTKLYDKAVENNGEIVIKNEEGINLDNIDFKSKNIVQGETKEEVDTSTNPFHNDNRFEQMPNMPDKSDSESMLYIKVFILSNGDVEVVFLNSIITPVDATVKTLRIQLIYISIIMIMLSLVIAALISNHISKPIIKVNNTAKKMAKGDFEVVYDEGTFKEVGELSKTLNYAAGELKKTEDLRREIIANVSHDLRTPLTMITAYAEVMRDIPGENTPDNVQVIVDEAKRLTNLVNDLLDISKIQSGVCNFEMKEYNLTEGIKSVINRYSKLIEQDGYKISFQYEEENVIVEADEFKIYQVLYNLMNNAINYTGEDKAVIVKQIVNGSIVRIEVRDTGEGIDEHELNNVWERYYKIDKQHKRAVMGTGLGLSIVQNILKAHNAQFGVDSEKGKGCIFWFELKIK